MAVLNNSTLLQYGVLACTLASLAVPTATLADSVSVSPTKLLVAPSGTQTTLTVKAGGKEDSVLQVRVMQWNEKDNPSKMRATRDVVVSPPVVKLRPRQELTVRIVRVSKKRVRGRECYRVLVDRLPGKEQAGQSVKLQVRHSVPLCFTS